MQDLDDLIQYENESTRLDFKKVQYAKHSYEALLKDIMAMANANVIDDRYIIVGVQHRADGTKDFTGIPDNEFVDSAIYHQLVRENIEPEVHFEYQPYRFRSVLLGVFRIYSCADQPYMMRKQYGQGLRAGDAYIRKGTHQTRISRSDLDRINLSRSDSSFSGILKVGFDVPGAPSEISVPASSKLELPSEQAANTIRAILAERERVAINPSLAAFGHRVIGAGSLGILYQNAPYAQRSNEELKRALETVESIYHRHDMYAVYEERAVKLNLLLLNEGTNYIEDASIQVTLPRLKGMLIAERIHHQPQDDVGIPSYLDEIAGREYPNVELAQDHVRITAHIGDLRHRIAAKGFQEPLRVIFFTSAVGQRLELECTVYGKQLREPRRSILSVLITSPVDA
jgi:hypothetical protein